MPGPITDEQRKTITLMENLELSPVVICDDERQPGGLYVAFNHESGNWTTCIMPDGRPVNTLNEE